jgi:hypothetical protein
MSKTEEVIKAIQLTIVASVITCSMVAITDKENDSATKSIAGGLLTCALGVLVPSPLSKYDKKEIQRNDDSNKNDDINDNTSEVNPFENH